MEEDDIVDEHATLPKTINFQCSQMIIRSNYALCLQFWEDGFNRKDLLGLIIKQLKSLDFKERKLKKIENLPLQDMAKIDQIIQYMF